MGLVRAQPQASHGPWPSPAAIAQGLVLTVDGPSGPNEKEGGSSSRLAMYTQGMEAVWLRPPWEGSVHDSPARRARKSSLSSVQNGVALKQPVSNRKISKRLNLSVILCA